MRKPLIFIRLQDPIPTRRCSLSVVLDQIGRMTVGAISGFRWSALVNDESDTVGISLPVSAGYTVEVILHASDTYTVRRVFTRGGKRWIKGEKSNIFCDQLSQTAYDASCFVNVDFGKHLVE